MSGSWLGIARFPVKVQDPTVTQTRISYQRTPLYFNYYLVCARRTTSRHSSSVLHRSEHPRRFRDQGFGHGDQGLGFIGIRIGV